MGREVDRPKSVSALVSTWRMLRRDREKEVRPRSVAETGPGLRRETYHAVYAKVRDM